VWPEIFTFELFGKSFPLRSFGLLVALGFVVGVRVAQKLATKYGTDPKNDPLKIPEVGWSVLIGVILGARLGFVLVNWEHYSNNPLSILAIWEGGLVMYGGLILALILGIRKVKQQGMEVWKGVDYMLTAGFLGQAVGRLGCLAVGDDYGSPTQVPWAITFPNPLPTGSAFAPELAGMAVHPTQPYMVLKAFSLFLLGLWLLRNKRFHGQVTVILFGFYGVLRSIVEEFRGDDFARDGIFQVGLSPAEVTTNLKELGMMDGYGRFIDIPAFQKALADGIPGLRPDLLISTSQMVAGVCLVFSFVAYRYLGNRADLRLSKTQ
jgi:phosphatidylglycerol:prolipoprotein diacylglycerol transferase